MGTYLGYNFHIILFVCKQLLLSLKFGTWALNWELALTREWALAQDIMVIMDSDTYFVSSKAKTRANKFNGIQAEL